ncbi:hypothetical protein LCGC14_2253980 [marine sediment metagenome]|uniref:Uncharacterized protein n=1 Tax=marine sediment metagenome TaxID=412755 RepID=A0A0F9DP59_9ZZZZ
MNTCELTIKGIAKDAIIIKSVDIPVDRDRDDVCEEIISNLIRDLISWEITKEESFDTNYTFLFLSDLCKYAKTPSFSRKNFFTDDGMWFYYWDASVKSFKDAIVFALKRLDQLNNRKDGAYWYLDDECGIDGNRHDNLIDISDLI